METESDCFHLVNIAGTIPLHKMLKDTAVPHIFKWTKEPTDTIEERGRRAKRRRCLKEESDRGRETAWETVGAEAVLGNSD